MDCYRGCHGSAAKGLAKVLEVAGSNFVGCHFSIPTLFCAMLSSLCIVFLECNQLYCNIVSAHSFMLPLLSPWVPSSMSPAGRSIAESDLVFDLTAYLKSSPCARRVLLQALQDSFEANKEIALQLLLELPVDVDLFEVRTYVRTYVQYSTYCMEVHYNRLKRVYNLNTLLLSHLSTSFCSMFVSDKLHKCFLGSSVVFAALQSLQAHTEWCFGMSCSPKSVDCTTAAYNWRLLTARGCEGVSTLLEEQNADLRCHLRDILRKEEKDWREEVRDGKNGSGEEDRTEGDEERWRRNMENRELKLQSRECSPPGGSGSAVMETLLLLVDTLSLHRAAAGCSLTAASLHAPMYGVIEAIAAILSSSRR